MKEINNVYIKIINLSLIILIIILSVYLGKRFYFNEFYYKVPDLIGLDMAEAEKTISSSALNIRNMGETFSTLPYGKVAMQEPKAGAVVKKSRNIKIWTSMESPAVFLDDLTGINYLDAISIAERKGMIVDEITKINSQLPINYVIATSPKSGEPLARGTKISFLISNGNSN
ncbi:MULTISPECIES: PASTA domain-containing protein [Fusobacterium]|uniref:PASTA domain-containing protein n=3 Tax=Fusobacteriaceae TaxID=203492 RepID=UPI0025C11DC8|nr:PASTA domain-containing protein [Fusobacterium sp.]MDD7392600.1 PASTA domain-containing protein [Fusobacteriaceae bacterium]MDY5305868.1 PASTA domain-containing protein [Fusobacterium gastrosuis]MCI5724655.1 PASTA domain-containing protein [Fusobacterium sp.]MDD7411375.1 PASTA domain-containing protein [Fusobacteriaceae bacterium]MDY5713729.1 PASTA domain-containing protein [Fusobacterium gastrosuis]